MRDQYMRKGEGFLICYSITDRRSFEEAVEYKKLIDRVRNREDVPICLVGNKCDLESYRKVSLNISFNQLMQFLPEIAVWISDTFDDNFGIEDDLTKYLKESC